MRSRKLLVVVLTNNVAVNMDKSRDCMPRDSKTMKMNQLLCGRGIPCKDEGFERENSLTLVLLTMFIFYKLGVHKNYGIRMLKMHGDMYCINRLLHIGKSSGNYTFTMNH